MDIVIGSVIAVTGVLTLINSPYSQQKITGSIYYKHDSTFSDPVLTADQFTDNDGTIALAFDSSQLVPTFYILRLSYKPGGNVINVDLPFTLVEDDFTITLTVDKPIFTAGEDVTFTATIMSVSSIPKANVTVLFTQVGTPNQWTVITNNAGVASVVLHTDPDFDGIITIDATFGGKTAETSATSTVAITLTLQADRDVYRIGDTARLTATLERGSQPYPDQDISFVID